MKITEKRRISLIVFLLVIISLTACTSEVKTQSTIEAAPVTITGEGINISINSENIKTYPEVTRTTSSISSSGEVENHSCKGVLLNDIINDKNVSQSDYKSIRAIASDSYEIDIPRDILTNREIVIAYEMDGKPLKGELRTVVPEERAMYWVKNLSKLQLVSNAEIKNELSEMIFMEGICKKVPTESIDYYGNEDKAVQISELLKLLKINSDSDVSFTATENFKSVKKWQIFNSGKLKITGEDSPLFIVPELPVGMRVKTVSSITFDKYIIISRIGNFDKESLKVNDLFRKYGFKESAQYIFIDAEGKEIKVTGDEVKEATMTIDKTSKYISISIHNQDFKNIVKIKAL
jgi:hypothetical protein